MDIQRKSLKKLYIPFFASFIFFSLMFGVIELKPSHDASIVNSPNHITKKTSNNSLKEIWSSDVDNTVDGYAIICGISDYPGIVYDLDYSDDDGQHVKKLIQKKFGIPNENIFLLLDDNCTEIKIMEAINDVKQFMDDNDYLLFFYSGHGTPILTNPVEQAWSISSPHPYPDYYDNYWYYTQPGAAMIQIHFDYIRIEESYDKVYVGDGYNAIRYYYEMFSGSYGSFWTDWIESDKVYVELISDESVNDDGFVVDKIRYVNYTGESEIVPHDKIDEGGINGSALASAFSGISGKIVALFDSCYSGGIGASLNDSGLFVMTASLDNESALEDLEKQGGVFTNSFIEAWTNINDTNNDSQISLEELFTLVNSSVINRSTMLGTTQHPQMFDGLFGETILTPFVSNLTYTIDSDTLNGSLLFNQGGLGTSSVKIIYYDVTQKRYFPGGNFLIPATSSVVNLSIQKVNDSSSTLAMSVVVNRGYGIVNSMLSLSAYKTGSPHFQNIDSDGDSVLDIYEFHNGTNPWSNDTDGDGIDDAIEIHYHLNPLVAETSFDFDLDGMPTDWELEYGLNIFEDDSNLDHDRDNLTNIEEFNFGSSPISSDTDGDGLNDYLEYISGTIPTNPDTDGDSFSDGFEYSYGFDPLDPLNNPVTLVLIPIVGVISILVICAALTKHKAKKKKAVQVAEAFWEMKSSSDSDRQDLATLGDDEYDIPPDDEYGNSFKDIDALNDFKGDSFHYHLLGDHSKDFKQDLAGRGKRYDKLLIENDDTESSNDEFQSIPFSWSRKEQDSTRCEQDKDIKSSSPLIFCPRCGIKLVNGTCPRCGFVG
ncbi:MAG: caspase family protein [Promethearchaeota archaeon]